MDIDAEGWLNKAQINAQNLMKVQDFYCELDWDSMIRGNIEKVSIVHVWLCTEIARSL